MGRVGGGEGRVGLPRCYFWINWRDFKKFGKDFRLSLAQTYAYFYQHGYTCISTRHALGHKKWEGPTPSYMLFLEKIQNGTEYWKI